MRSKTPKERLIQFHEYRIKILKGGDGLSDGLYGM